MLPILTMLEMTTSPPENAKEITTAKERVTATSVANLGITNATVDFSKSRKRSKDRILTRVKRTIKAPPTRQTWLNTKN